MDLLGSTPFVYELFWIELDGLLSVNFDREISLENQSVGQEQDKYRFFIGSVL